MFLLDLDLQRISQATHRTIITIGLETTWATGLINGTTVIMIGHHCIRITIPQVPRSQNNIQIDQWLTGSETV